MSEKRFIVENDNNEVSIKDKVEDNYPFALAYEHIDDADNLIQECLSLVGLLNEQQAIIDEQKIAIDEMITDYKNLEKENEQLKQKIQRWKNLYELKDSEVTARVDALNKVCEYYTFEVLFKSDTNPNQAVKEVINAILNTEVKK